MKYKLNLTALEISGTLEAYAQGIPYMACTDDKVLQIVMLPAMAVDAGSTVRLNLRSTEFGAPVTASGTLIILLVTPASL